jgi:SAM-dependent methyltransferase
MASSLERAELARIRNAYERYATDERERRRRDPLNPGLQELQREWMSLLAKRLLSLGLPTANSRVLDVGCGSGDLLALFIELGADPVNCSGIDLIPARAEATQKRLPDTNVFCGDASTLPWPDGTFDLVSMSLIVSSILSESLADKVCSEAARVLGPGGILVWYDTRLPNPFNRQVRSVRARTIRKLFPGFHLELESVSVLPPLARGLGRFAPTLYPLLAAIPPLRARYLALLRTAEQS